MFYESDRIVRKNAGHHIPPTTSSEVRTWSSSPPVAEPWRSRYLALSVEQQQRWDSMSPAARSNAFGVP